MVQVNDKIKKNDMEQLKSKATSLIEHAKNIDFSINNTYEGTIKSIHIQELQEAVNTIERNYSENCCQANCCQTLSCQSYASIGTFTKTKIKNSYDCIDYNCVDYNCTYPNCKSYDCVNYNYSNCTSTNCGYNNCNCNCSSNCCQKCQTSTCETYIGIDSICQTTVCQTSTNCKTTYKYEDEEGKTYSSVNNYNNGSIWKGW